VIFAFKCAVPWIAQFINSQQVTISRRYSAGHYILRHEIYVLERCNCRRSLSSWQLQQGRKSLRGLAKEGLCWED